MDRIDALLDDFGEIPTLPAIASAIMNKTLDENINARQIAEMVEKDQALAARVLRMANSAFYRRIKEISTIRGAVVLLGLNVLKSIILSVSVVNVFDNKNKNAIDLYKFWQHSIACAACARGVAAKSAPALAEDAFMAGLLHDIGKVILDQVLCNQGEYRQVLDEMTHENRFIVEVERKIVGIDHASMGQHLTERWNLPPMLCTAIGGHHTLSGGIEDPKAKKLCSIVHIADMITNHLGLGLVDMPTGFIEPSLLKQMNLSSNDIQDISITLKEKIAQISEQMGIPKAEPKTYFEVLQSANSQLGRLSLDLEQKKQALERRTVELSSLNQMSSQLQSCMKLSEITTVLTSHSLSILDVSKCRCMIQLSNLRIMITESFWISDSVHTRTGVTGGTKELIDRARGLYPKDSPVVFSPIRTKDRIIGVIEAVGPRNKEIEEQHQKELMLRTISEMGAQAIQRATLIAKNIKAQKLAAVSKTAIAANHEINSPLTTILLKLDMLINDPSISQKEINDLKEAKKEALKINTVVKKMLQISDVVETDYTQNEKMLDIQGSVGKAGNNPVKDTSDQKQDEEIPGFEDYLTKPQDKTHETKDKPAKTKDTSITDVNITPGFEDYLKN